MRKERADAVMDSGAKNLPGVSSVSVFLGRLTEKEMALEEEVGAGSGEEIQERAGAGEGEVAGSVLEEEGVPGVHYRVFKGGAERDGCLRYLVGVLQIMKKVSAWFRRLHLGWRYKK